MSLLKTLLKPPVMDIAVPIDRALSAVGELLAAAAAEVRVVLVGGAALRLLGIVERTTADVDVIALGVGTGGNIRLVPPEPIPEALARAIALVARDLDLPPNWMNTVVASQWKTGLPPEFAEGLTWRRYGGLWVGSLAGSRSCAASSTPPRTRPGRRAGTTKTSSRSHRRARSSPAPRHGSKRRIPR